MALAPSGPTDLECQLAFETLMSEVSARLIAAPDQTFASTIETALEETARFLGADRGQLLSVHAPLSEVRVLHAWYADTVESHDRGAPAASLAEHMPWAADLIVAKRQPLVMSALDELPPDAQRDRASFTARGVRSAVWIPIVTGPDLQYLLSIEATNGEVRWPHALVPRLLRLGEILGHIVDRKRVADALRETTARITLADAEHRANIARLEAAADAAGLGFYLMSPPGETALLDDRARALFGIPPDQETRTRTFWLEHVHPDDRDRVVQASREVHAGDVDRVSRVYRYLHPTRGLVWLRHTTRTFERDESVRPARVAGVVQDITEQKRIEWGIREREARLAAAAELAGLGFYDLDFGKGLAFADDRFRDLCGIPAAELEGFRAVDFWREHVHPDDRPRIDQVLQQGHAGALDRVSLEYRFLHPARGERWFQHVATVVSREEPGGVVRSFGVLQDITERRRAEEWLRQSFAETTRQKDRLQAESDYLKAEIKVVDAQHEIIGQSAAIRKVLGLVEQVAPMDSSVLIHGETGTGKELVAQAIHRLSPRGRHVMVKINCAALPAGLVESELFGREKGAFTGALTRQAGRFEVADGSTLFLDEVSELPPDVQVKLLRVLQEGEFERLGSPRTIKVNVRVIAATNRDLAAEVRKGRFREDLYYRLNVFPIHVPPLRQRAEDIPPLVWGFLRDLCARMGKKITQVPRSTMEALQRAPWPGNVRELRNVIEYGAIVTTGDTLVVPMLAEASPMAARPQTLTDIERAHILRALESTGWRIKGPKGAAAALGINYGTLYGRMKKLGIRRQPQPE
jgi:formate hydrogenlyase transcriptional activator